MRLILFLHGAPNPAPRLAAEAATGNSGGIFSIPNLPRLRIERSSCPLAQRLGMGVMLNPYGKPRRGRLHMLVDAPDGVSEATLRNHLTDQFVRYKLPRGF